MLSLPLPVEKLWQWSLSSSKKKGAASDHTEKAASFNALKTAQAR
jgi:hypothetical protein